MCWVEEMLCLKILIVWRKLGCCFGFFEGFCECWFWWYVLFLVLFCWFMWLWGCVCGLGGVVVRLWFGSWGYGWCGGFLGWGVGEVFFGEYGGGVLLLVLLWEGFGWWVLLYGWGICGVCGGGVGVGWGMLVIFEGVWKVLWDFDDFVCVVEGWNGFYEDLWGL